MKTGVRKIKQNRENMKSKLLNRKQSKVFRKASDEGEFCSVKIFFDSLICSWVSGLRNLFF